MTMRPKAHLLIVAVLTGLLLWTGCTPPVLPTTAPALDEAGFWDDFPLPDDAELIPPPDGYGLAFDTAMVEPELFDFYTEHLQDEGWSRQAPTEAMITLPHQRWRKDGVDLIIELQSVNEAGRTIVACRVE
jgi:hypothetical protein